VGTPYVNNRDIQNLINDQADKDVSSEEDESIVELKNSSHVMFTKPPTMDLVSILVLLLLLL